MLIYRNGLNVEGATHKYVVDLIKKGGSELTLTVISVPNFKEDQGEPSDDSSGYSYYDFSDRKPIPITVPDYRHVTSVGDKHVVRLFDVLLTFMLPKMVYVKMTAVSHLRKAFLPNSHDKNL